MSPPSGDRYMPRGRDAMVRVCMGIRLPLVVASVVCMVCEAGATRLGTLAPSAGGGGVDAKGITREAAGQHQGGLRSSPLVGRDEAVVNKSPLNVEVGRDVN